MDGASKSVHVWFSICHQAHLILSRVCAKWVKREGRHIYSSDLRHSQLLAVNHEATCCQLCVVTCASVACEQKAFILLQLPHPRKVFFCKGEYQLELWACRTQMAVHRPQLISQRDPKRSVEQHALHSVVRHDSHSSLNSIYACIDLWLVSFNQVKDGAPLAGRSSDLSVLLPVWSGWIKWWVYTTKEKSVSPRKKLLVASY